MNVGNSDAMPERMLFDYEPTDHPRLIRLTVTNLNLSPDGIESYPDRSSGEAGSLAARTVFAVEGVEALRLEGGEALVTLAEDAIAEMVMAEVIEAVRDLFL